MPVNVDVHLVIVRAFAFAYQQHAAVTHFWQVTAVFFKEWETLFTIAKLGQFNWCKLLWITSWLQTIYLMQFTIIIIMLSWEIDETDTHNNISNMA